MATTLSTGIILPDNNDYVTRANERSNLQTISDKIIEGENNLTTHKAETPTEAAKGHIQIATTAEATTGTDNTKAMTPAKTKTVVDAMGAVKSPLRYTSSTIAAGKTLALTDANKRILCNSDAAMTITVPTNATVAFAVGDEIEILAWGTGTVTIAAASGVTIRSKESKLAIDGQFAGASLLKIGTDEWLLIGSLA